MRRGNDSTKRTSIIAFQNMNEVKTIICPLCRDSVDKLVYRYHIGQEREVLNRIRNQNPEWSEHDGLCSRCVDYYHTELILRQRILPEIGPHFPVKSADDFIILPTGLRLDADPRYTGKGVTICFIDSGFYPHPDLVSYKNRVRVIVDIPNGCSLCDGEVAASSWHGTMTSVVCAGDGYLSNGLYKGIASDAELVLLKVQDHRGQITDNSIVSALRWILANHLEYDIRIVNISLGTNDGNSFRESEIDLLTEELICQGVSVVAAVGNDVSGTVKAPANSPNVITVGGIDDENRLGTVSKKLYHSSFEKTVDDFMKPELVAHAMWIAAPILPYTKEQQEVTLLNQFLKLPYSQVQAAVQAAKNSLSFYPDILASTDASSTKELIKRQLLSCKYISEHYMHVDGTSVAAPIVTAVIAQLLEINPALTPPMIRALLFSTSSRIPGLPAERQGFGVVQPRKACLKTLKQISGDQFYASPVIDIRRNSIQFYTQDYCASQISLTGSFNLWEADVLLLEPGKNGMWKIELPMLPRGHYRYKFVVDEKLWIEDANNPYREPDGLGGFNSLLIIEN
jgi:serine protease AprX